MGYQNMRNYSVSLHGNRFKEGYGFDTTAYTKQHVVNWSGGADSTLCLYELLKEYGPNHVTAISFNHPWLDEAKAAKELEYRNKFKEFITKEFPNGFNHVEFTQTVKPYGTPVYPKPGGNAQSTSWLLTEAVYLDDGDYFYDTSVIDDDITLHTHELINCVESIEMLLNRKIVFRQPYIYYHKYEIIHCLMQYGIYDYTWTCELPKDGHECLECCPCKLMISNLYYLKNFDGVDKVKNQATERLSRYKKLLDASKKDEKITTDSKTSKPKTTKSKKSKEET